ncbi:GNAT family N-acetyltransferase [Sphingobacterium sp. SG20118]|uniref:GNAT family N-acetyltransferase n=1 Tax=Sphingobacterium sp. SG20118 TaxID=3367156 RepID=UPI0037DFC5B3
MKFHHKTHQRHFDEVKDWLLKEHRPGSNSFHNEIDNIEHSFNLKKMSCLTFENKTIGFATWRLQDRIAYIDLFEINPLFRNRSLGRQFFEKLASLFVNCGIYVIELKFISDESEAFWTKVGFRRFKGNNFPSVTPTSLYKVIVESQPLIGDATSDSCIEIWDNHYISAGESPFTTYDLNFENGSSGKLVLPIVTTCHYDWVMRFTLVGTTSSTLKIKHFDSTKYHPNFLIVESL